MAGNVELVHSVDQRRGNFAAAAVVVVVAALVVEQLLYHFVSAAEPVQLEENNLKLE